jgi:hypothetical protein
LKPVDHSHRSAVGFEQSCELLEDIITHDNTAAGILKFLFPETFTGRVAMQPDACPVFSVLAVQEIRIIKYKGTITIFL